MFECGIQRKRAYILKVNQPFAKFVVGFFGKLAIGLKQVQIQLAVLRTEV